MSSQFIEPNDFTLGTVDERISVTFSQFGFIQPQLTYHNETDPTGGGTYTHDQIQIEETSLGRLVTVVLDDQIDVERRTLTLVVPRIVLEQGSEEGVEVSTFVVFARSRESRAHRGQMQHFEVVEVQGTATYVDDKAM